MIFIEKGKYDYGYEVNKKRIFRRRFGPSTIIGGFEMIKKTRHMFLIRAYTDISGFAIIKKDWDSIMSEFTHFKNEISSKILFYYFK